MTKENNSNFHSITKEYTMTSDYLMADSQKIDLSYILQALIDTSEAHDKKIGVIMSQSGETILGKDDSWVITQYNIFVHQLPELNDVVSIRTRVLSANRFFVSRYFEVFLGDTLLIEAFVQFAGINLIDRKIVRLNVKSLLEMDIIDRSIEAEFERIKVPEEVAFQNKRLHEIVQEDIDHNSHVNNGAYLRWCYRELPEDFLLEHEIEHVEVKYGKEVLPDHQVEIESYIAESTGQLIEEQTVQIIQNLTTQQEACRVSIKWQARE